MNPIRCLLFVTACLLSFWRLSNAQVNLTESYFSGNYQEVIDNASGLISSGDTSLNTFYLKALSEAQLGHPQIAIGTLKDALSIYPGEIRIGRMLARQYYDTGDYIKARESYGTLVTRDSTDISSWLKLAEIGSYRQQYDEEKDALQQVLIIDSLNLESLLMMGELLNRQNNSEAVTYYERAFDIYPDNQKAAYALGNWYIQAKEPQKAIPICEHMMEVDSTSIKFSKLLGYACYKSGDPWKAVPWFEKSIALGDTTVFTCKFIGISQYLMADFTGAIKSLNLAVKKDSLDAEVHFFLGASLATTTLKSEAIDHLEKSLQLMQPDPSITARIYSEEGNIRRLEMKYDEAYSLYKKAWQADTTAPMPLYYMASILDNSMHRSKEALEDYQKFLELLDQTPPSEQIESQIPAIRDIVEDRIITLKEELFFRDDR